MPSEISTVLADRAAKGGSGQCHSEASKRPHNAIDAPPRTANFASWIIRLAF